MGGQGSPGLKTDRGRTRSEPVSGKQSRSGLRIVDFAKQLLGRYVVRVLLHIAVGEDVTVRARNVLQDHGGEARDVVGANDGVVVERQNEVHSALIVAQLLHARRIA